MENIERIDEAVPATAFSLSWVAYVRPTVFFLIALGFAGLFKGAIHLLLSLLAAAWFVYLILDARAVRLFVNNDGIWVRSGILPWNKGVSGLLWRDLDSASYYTGFISWAAKSYKVRIGHRFTKSSEIFLQHVRDGNRAVEVINGMHREMVADARV
ncbi:hypothetical protein SAMN02800692_3605 [Luteibacter sp. UNC138MFCol5.1]|uniref:hypothetical protein n=1 Tax=Luteibacter sp. UNC138MFCol5.1 TaxID=1502774 RepID=UPI0008C32FC9|nr:hypothetical protein [Luteibacter sp. UNC138MFCol5.1]SEP09296.1 hypothetical protein SAMN02800692_3605 [Luteibacter sp. UNC138MFCol5.1]